MYTVKTWEHEQSENVTWRVFHTLDGAYKFTKNGGFYKAQIIGDCDEVIYEFKA